VITPWSQRHLGARLSPHKLRHLYGKRCVNLGVDVRVIAESLGHESLEFSWRPPPQRSRGKKAREIEQFSVA
jgi:integrase